MKGILLLAWRYLLFNKVKSAVLTACLTITLFLPLAVQSLVHYFNTTLTARADATPLFVGAKGNRYDLVLKSLYFTTNYPDTIAMSDIDIMKERGFGLGIPLYIRYTAHKFFADAAALVDTVKSVPLVGTTLAYFKFRTLAAKQGTLPLFLGDAVVGSQVARELGLAVGDSILSDPLSAYDPARSFQLKMPVVGILGETGTADDAAIFTDVKTQWVIDGIGHGHQDLARVDDPTLADKSNKANVVGTAKVLQYQEITDENRKSFHFHGDAEKYPITSSILVPRSDKMRTIAQAWYNASETREILVPSDVVQELMGLVFKAKRFFEANFALILVTTLLFMSLVILLSARLRRREMEVLYKIGCARATAFWLQATELMIVLIISLGLAMLGSVSMLQAAPLFMRLFQS